MLQESLLNPGWGVAPLQGAVGMNASHPGFVSSLPLGAYTPVGLPLPPNGVAGTRAKVLRAFSALVGTYAPGLRCCTLTA